MSLRPSPFERIASGKKTIELRLYDEKRQLIQVGDTIVFTETDDPSRTVSATVKALHLFDSFAGLYASLPLDRCGYLPSENADPRDMEKYYPPEKQRMYGVVGIEIELE